MADTTTTPEMVEGEEPQIHTINLGDLNGDGEINVLDIVIVANMILAGEYEEMADMNEDGELNVLDVVILANWIFQGTSE